MRWQQLLVLVLGCILIIVFVYRDELFPRTTADRVDVGGRLASDCPREQPLELTVSNRSTKAMRGMFYDVEVHPRGDSRNLAAADQPPWTRIVEPGRTAITCVSVEMNYAWPSDPVVIVKERFATFYEAGETIPK